MGNVKPKIKKGRERTGIKPGKTKKVISDEEIRRRAFEIFQQNDVTYHNDLDDWFRAERELSGFDE